MGTVGISCLVYTLMALSMSMMVTPEGLSACGSSTGDPVADDYYDASTSLGAPAAAQPPPNPDMPNADACAPGTFKNYGLAFSYAFSVNGERLPGRIIFILRTLPPPEARCRRASDKRPAQLAWLGCWAAARCALHPRPLRPAPPPAAPPPAQACPGCSTSWR
jgi:hypothetical protein